MNRQLFNVLAQKTRGNPFQTVKNISEGEGCCGARAWVKLLGAYKGNNATPSESMTSSVCRRSQKYLPTWKRGKEHVKDIGCEVADITMANCLRRLVPTDLCADLQKMSHIVRYGDVKKYIIDQVGLQLCYDQQRPALQ